jgi:hypothetical protein
LVVSLVGLASTSSARVDLCEAGLSKEQQKYRKAVIQRLGKCVDFIRKERDFQGPKGKDNNPKAAFLCQKQLVKLADLGNVGTGSDAYSKLLAGIDKLVPAKCAPGDMDKLGHLVAGVSAPPYGAGVKETDWVKYKIAVGEIYESFVSVIKSSPRADELIQELLQDPVDPKDTDSFLPADCTTAPCADAATCHQDLCAWHKNDANERNNYWEGTGRLRNMCFQHTCVLDCNPGNPPLGSYSVIRLAQPGSEATDGINVIFPPVCGSSTNAGCRTIDTPRFKDLLHNSGTPIDFRGGAQAPGSTVQNVRLNANSQTCVRALGGSTWTDCEDPNGIVNVPDGGLGVGIDVVSCVDHSVPFCDGEFCQNCEAGGNCRGGSNDPEPCTDNTPCLGGGTCDLGCEVDGETPCDSDQDCGDNDCKYVTAQPANDENCFCSTTTPPCGDVNEPDCVPILTASCTSHTDCTVGECIARDSGAACHVGTYNSRVFTFFDGASVHGDHITWNANQLTTTTDNGSDGICVNGGADEGDECSLDGDCDSNDCLAFIGRDGVPCTGDDIVSRGTSGFSVITSGSAIASVEEALYVVGACSIGGQPCYADVNCTGDETCDGVGLDRIEPPVPFTGSPLDCAQRSTSNLAGLQSAGSFGFPDGATLGDGTSTSVYICQ